MSGICPNHGPYDGSSCPYPPPHGEGQRPRDPGNLDDEPTEIGQGRVRYDDSGEAPTEIPGGGARGTGADETENTDVGQQDHEFLTEPDEPPMVTLAMLWVKDGRKRGKVYPIKHGTVIGRKGDLFLDDPKVSSMHAKFKLEGDDIVIWDMGSFNGTIVNGKKIRGATVLEENDLVKIGDTVFVVKLLNPRNKRKVTPTVAKAKRAKKAPARKSSAKKPSKR